MKSFRQLREAKEPRVRIAQSFDVYRDGGSHGHVVLNTEECGFVRVIQDFSIHSKKNQTEGKFFGMLPPPNHLNTQWVPISADSLDWD